MTLFHVEIDAHMYASNIEEALCMLAEHFRNAWLDCRGELDGFDGIFVTPSQVHIGPTE